DWSSDGRLAVVQVLGARWRIEFPIGKVIYETDHAISHLRLSPKGDLLAFIDHPLPPDDTGFVAVVDLAGHERLLTPRYNSAQGLAWTPSGGEIWYTAAEFGINAALRAVKPDGSSPPRVVARVPGRLNLHDIARDGRVLLGRETWRVGSAGVFPGDAQERDVSWLDLSFATDVSADGKTVLLSEQGEGGGPQYSVYLRKTDGSPAVRLGDGYGPALSPDGRWVLTFLRTSPAQLVLLPTGAGETRPLPRGPIESYVLDGAWFPDSKRVVFVASERGHGQRLYAQDIAGGDPRPISPEGTSALSAFSVSPDGEFVAAADANEKAWLYPVAGGQPRPVPGAGPREAPIRVSADGHSLYVRKLLGLLEIYKVALATGRRQLWKQIRPADPAGWVPFFFVNITPDGKYYTYTYARILSDLYLVEGLK
ncbi:MAG TPA: hypothetical protein VEU62_01655, partial [Bryobacterales bacterium]|nr:hypothetical protein [Bryobacterales bacterium]